MEELISLSDAIKLSDFPIVARLCDTSEVATESFIEGKEVLLQRHMKVKYAQVKVLDFNDKDKIQDRKGIDFVMEHDNYVADTFMIPSKYTAPLKFIHRPGSWRRFASISQVLHVLPRFVRVGEEIVVFPSNGLGKNVIIPAKTILEVIRKFSDNGITYLECRDGTNSFSFRETDRVNFTEVEDERIYKMYELVRIKLLPKTFQFLDVEPEDVMQLNEELNSGLLTVAEGPLELIKFVDVDIVVGWLRDNSKRTYKTFIIPRRIWPLIKLQIKVFPVHGAKDVYIERRYNNCTNTDFVEKTLYKMSVDETNIIWLASPDFFERNYTGSSMFKVVCTGYKDSDGDSDDDNYSDMHDCAPPIPDSSTNLPTELPTDLLPRVKEKMKIFGRVHKELMKWFMPKSSCDQQKSPANKNLRTIWSVSENNKREVHHTKYYKRKQCKEAMKEDTGKYLHPMEKLALQYQSDKIESTDILPIKNLFSSEECLDSDSDTNESESSCDYDYIEPEEFEFSYNACSKQKSNLQSMVMQADPPYFEADEIESDLENSLSDSQIKIKTAEVNDLDCPGFPNKTLNSLEHKGNNQNKCPSPMDGREISTQNELEEVFYRYSVLETMQCFKLCALDEFAEKCWEYKLDGSFFRNFDLQTLIEEPFHFTSFQILKIKKIIFEGWRPKH